MDNDTRKKIFELAESGQSFQEIALALKKGKTTVHAAYHRYLKENGTRSVPSEQQNDNTVLHSESPETAVLRAKLDDIDVVPEQNGTPENTMPQEILTGPFPALMELMPSIFHGMIHAGTHARTTKLAWRLACFLSKYHTPVEIITDKLDKYKYLVEDPGFEMVTIWNCVTADHINNELTRTPSKIIIFDSLNDLKVDMPTYMSLRRKYPDKAFVGLQAKGLLSIGDHDFIIRIEDGGAAYAFTELKTGMMPKYYADISRSYLYEAKMRPKG